MGARTSLGTVVLAGALLGLSVSAAAQDETVQGNLTVTGNLKVDGLNLLNVISAPLLVGGVGPNRVMVGEQGTALHGQGISSSIKLEDFYGELFQIQTLGGRTFISSVGHQLNLDTRNVMYLRAGNAILLNAGEGSGRVGVNTYDPKAMLDVAGIARFDQAPSTPTTLTANVGVSDSTLLVVSTAGYPRAGVLRVDGEVMEYSGSTPTSFTGVTRGVWGTVADAHQGPPTLPAAVVENYLMTLAANGTPTLAVTARGWVGIGTPAPRAMLHINGETPAIELTGKFSTFMRVRGSAPFISLKDTLTNGGNGASMTLQAFNNEFAYIGSTRHLVLAPGNAERMRVTSTGNVGIGVTAPLSLLEVGSKGYLQFDKTSAGLPPLADCDEDAERGRLSIDTVNNRLYVCNGKRRGWDFIPLRDL